MQKVRIALFEYFTFQLLPTRTTQLDLFGSGIKDVDELRAKKNEIFASIILDKNFHFYYKGHRLNHKVFYQENNIIALRIANVKSIRAEKAFKEVVYENEPSIIIVINNNPKAQEIAIESNFDVFSKPESVLQFIKRSLALKLLEYSLEFEVHNQYSPNDFWALAYQYQNRIKQLKIELVRENMSDIYKTISDELVEFGDYMNAHKQIIIQEAPEGGVLEHVEQGNKQLEGFVEASAKGTGPISFRIVGSRKTISTKSKTIIKEVNVTEINNADQETLSKIIKKIFSKNA